MRKACFKRLVAICRARSSNRRVASSCRCLLAPSAVTMEPSDEQPSVLGSVLRSGDRVQIANLRRRWDLNTRGGTLVRWLPEAGRWQTKPDNIDTHISVSPENLIGIPCMMRDVETLIAQWQRERPSTQSLDAEFLGIGARHGAAVLMDPSLQPLLEHVARQRQKTL